MFALPGFATTYSWGGSTTAFGGFVSESATGNTWCQQYLVIVANYQRANNPTGSQETSVTASPSGAPTIVPQGGTCTTSPTGFSQAYNSQVSGLACSASSGNQDLLGTLAGAGSYTSGGGMCYNGCEYTNGNLVVTFGGANTRFAGKAVPTGVACGAAGSLSNDAPTTAGNCIDKAGVVACADSAGVRGTYSSAPGVVPDAIVPGTPGTGCISYASGAMACASSATTSPPVPSTATSPSTPATPTEVVTNNTSSTTTNYYSSSTVASAKGNTTQSGAGGAPTGTTTGSGSGTGSSGTGLGDCMLQPGEPNADDPAACSGSTPSLTRSDTVQSNIQGLYTGIGASPIMSALGAISSSVPSAGSCPTANVTLTTLSNHTFNFLDTACSIFAADLSTLVAISDTIWCILGVLIVMSA